MRTDSCSFAEIFVGFVWTSSFCFVLFFLCVFARQIRQRQGGVLEEILVRSARGGPAILMANLPQLQYTTMGNEPLHRI